MIIIPAVTILTAAVAAGQGTAEGDLCLASMVDEANYLVIIMAVTAGEGTAEGHSRLASMGGTGARKQPQLAFVQCVPTAQRDSSWRVSDDAASDA